MNFAFSFRSSPARGRTRQCGDATRQHAGDGLGKPQMPAFMRGFTLLELLVTVVIVGLLASIALPMTELVVQRSKEQDLRIALRDIRTALDAYRKVWDEGRIQKSVDDSGYPKSLAVLVEGVEDAKSPVRSKIYFLRRIPRDPTAQDTQSPAADTWGKRSYKSPADDPQEGEDVYDIYSLSTKVGLNGVRYREW